MLRSLREWKAGVNYSIFNFEGMNIGILISLRECYGSKWPKIDTFALVVRGLRNLPKMTAFLRRTSGTDRIQPRFHDGSSNLGEVSDLGTMFYAHWHSCFFFTFETWRTWLWWAESIEDFVSHLNELPVVLLCPTRSPLEFCNIQHTSLCLFIAILAWTCME